MQFEAKVIWHQPHTRGEGDDEIVLWQTRLYGENEGYGCAIDISTKGEQFDQTAKYTVSIEGPDAPAVKLPAQQKEASE